MESHPRKKAVILIGAPGSGKGTQAEILAKKFNLFHLQTSRLIEPIINNQELVKNDPETAEVKRLWDAGELVPFTWVVKIMFNKIEEVDSGPMEGIVFDGSPRTIDEARLEIPLLNEIFNQDQVKIFYIRLGPEESFKRNSRRRICEANQHPIPNFEEFKDVAVCPQDGSRLIVRSLDDPEVIRERYKVFLRRTEPIIGYLKETGYKVFEINGEQSIDKVTQDILYELSK
ncbi:MAG: Adenylate kinase [Candidatus Yanofskybacteria bacterium GW2011_GWF1_44_227]|uniref:Adenylate kinase n=1 Tax=Candidatus Yanofskybacteria bacterium GW2011_GWE2_40_11 TaxID=1619033 RepID=A0A0G0TQD2_9BACT|nr:MAG: Adenylate kinase [Candidatus Yanofskybacteria bacterium GW2011_GWE1_40_10]KKR40067.1 MAG: Adenylate kinase [Candidatus Yanofskybacteria bacterium GW2011_GWE2_40_11]KKT15054.1 MAG: Adenylate kinase [Candidatus Yanofskybacteria bacterium GW2011_GWF2_43_596]KKT52869.1 MAG: Adenylate kinase [Candidatus Yanofskybacteria bacterium GW2011_GWF1_44_227]OGN35660.1 MAG: hypothetical protein A2207_03745 [Candidatus Yanofskybacteria bacterium RIFOXYA1_FULL_44_17]OGN36697.1 MAG: hypothetical protein